MATLRAFFCAELDGGLRGELDRITTALRQAPVKASWVKRENLHVTLKFLGEVAESLVPDLEEAARRALRESEIDSRIEWTLDLLGVFPSLERPRVVWAGSSQEPEALARLAARLEQALESLGFEPERRSGVTHITLGRVKERAPSPNVSELTRALKEHPEFRYEARVDGLTLMRSELTPQGSIYTPVFRLPFSSNSNRQG